MSTLLWLPSLLTPDQSSFLDTELPYPCFQVPTRRYQLTPHAPASRVNLRLAGLEPFCSKPCRMRFARYFQYSRAYIFSRQLSLFSLCSSGLINFCLTGLFNYLSLMKVSFSPCYNPLWLTGLEAPTNLLFFFSRPNPQCCRCQPVRNEPVFSNRNGTLVAGRRPAWLSP